MITLTEKLFVELLSGCLTYHAFKKEREEESLELRRKKLSKSAIARLNAITSRISRCRKKIEMNTAIMREDKIKKQRKTRGKK